MRRRVHPFRIACVVAVLAWAATGHAGDRPAALPVPGGGITFQIVGLPGVLYAGESLNFLIHATNPAGESIDVDLTYATPDGHEHRKTLAVAARGERLAVFPMELARVPTESASGHISARVKGKEVFSATILFIDAHGDGNTDGLRTDGDRFTDARGRPVVLVNRYEDESEYRRWAPVKWAARAVRKAGAPYRIWTDTAAFDSFLTLLTEWDVAWNEAVPITDSASWPERLKAVDKLIPVDGALRLALAVDPDTSLSPWVHARWLDALVDRIRTHNPAVDIALVVPPPYSTENTPADGLAVEIRRLAREHHMAVFDASIPAGNGNRYVYDDDPVLLSRWPQPPNTARIHTPATPSATFHDTATSRRASEKKGVVEAVPWTRWMALPGVPAFDGASDGDSAAWPVDFPGMASLGTAWPAGQPVDRLTMEIRLPADAPGDLRLSAFVKDKDGLWFQTTAMPLSAKRFPRGQWQGVAFDFAPSARLEPVGHSAAWNAYHAARMVRGGLQLFFARPWTGTVHLRRPERKMAPSHADPSPSRFIRLEIPASPTAYRVAEWSFDLDPSTAFPCDPDAVRVDLELKAPDGRRFVRPAFFDQPQRRRLGDNEVEVVTPAGRASWKARFAPLMGGRHAWRLVAYAGGGAEPCLASQWHGLDVAPGAPRGFIRVSASDPRYFEDAAGNFFYPLGENIHAPFDKRAAEMLRVPVLPNRGTFAYEYYFEKMAALGQNSVVIWMSNWWVGIEWSRGWKGHGGLADYHLANAWKLDRVFAAAERHGIHINLVLDNHGKLSKWVDPEWDSNPYNVTNGGPCRTPEEFFTSPAAFEIYKKRLRYIVGRWGAHPNLLGLEIISEINLVGTNHSFKGNPAQAAWLKKVSAYLDGIDAYDRPITLQYSNDWQSVDARTASMPELDYLVGDAYKAGGSIVPMILETAKQNTRFGKPTFSAEFGGNWNGTTPQRLHSDLHCGLWANAMTATAGAPHFWWYDYIDRYDLYPEFAALAKFMKDEDRRGFHGVTRTLDPQRDGQSIKRDLGGVSYLDAAQGRGYLWLVDRIASEVMPEEKYARRHENVEVNLPGLAAGEYAIEYWNTFTGEVVHREVRAAGGGGLILAPPAFKIDLAVKILPAPPPDPPPEP